MQLFSAVLEADGEDVKAEDEAEAVAEPHREAAPEVDHAQNHAGDEPEEDAAGKNHLHTEGNARGIAGAIDVESLWDLADGHTDAGDCGSYRED